MNRKILTVIFTAITFTAVSDVSLYGRIAAALEYDTFSNPNQSISPETTVQDYTSYFGIRGTDNVYGQTSAIWQIEQFINIDSGQAYQKTTGSGWVPNHPGVCDGNSSCYGAPTSAINTLASSDSYIGLQGEWGKVRIGNLSNTFRTNTGAIDIYNGSNANVFANYDRMLFVLPQTLRYDSPLFKDFAFSTYYAFNTDGNFNRGGVNGNGIATSAGLNGFNNYGIYGFGLFYTPGPFSVTWNNQFYGNTGMYKGMGADQPGNIGDNYVQQGIDAYVSRIEGSYNDPDSWFIGIGAQISKGLAWFDVPGNGNLNNFWIYNPSANGVNSKYINENNCANGFCPLNQSTINTAELGMSFGWHIQNWTPKIGYIVGNNLMAGGSPWDTITGKNQIGNTGYQQVVAEMDWNITPRTIAFISYGQIWYGSAALNTVMMSNGEAPSPDSIEQYGSKWANNATTAIGFSHTF